MNRPAVLCPVDFSPASRGALRYAAALAEHFVATLAVLVVDDPFLVTAADAALGGGRLEAETRNELKQFVADAVAQRHLNVAELRLIQAKGKPAAEIHRVAAELEAGAIVMSTHGATGVRKFVFGSTTERVLRETRVPVIVTPVADPGPDSLEAWHQTIRALLVPVDFSAFTDTQVRVARGCAEALQTSLVLAHVVEPIGPQRAFTQLAAQADATRNAAAYRRLEELAATLPPALQTTVALAVGDPATEIAHIAQDLGASAIVMGLHAAPGTHRQMGTVTYRLLCQAPVSVIAWPPDMGGSEVPA